jgi:hypothetical protein
VLWLLNRFNWVARNLWKYTCHYNHGAAPSPPNPSSTSGAAAVTALTIAENTKALSKRQHAKKPGLSGISLLNRGSRPTLPLVTPFLGLGERRAFHGTLRDEIPTLLANPSAFTHNSLINASGGFAMAFRSRNFQFGLMLATALSVSMWPAASQAYTPEQEQACSGDAMRLCGAFVPDVDRITVCMNQNKSQLTPGCRAFFRENEAAATPVNAGRPMNIKPEGSRKPVKPRKSGKPANSDED